MRPIDRVSLDHPSTDFYPSRRLRSACRLLSEQPRSPRSPWPLPASMSATAVWLPSRAKRWDDCTPNAATAAGDDRYFVIDGPISGPPNTYLLARMREEFVEFVNAPNLWMVECLIVWPVRHHDQGVGFSATSLTILVAVVDEDADIELAHQDRLLSCVKWTTG